jgi:hypothetical protein
LKAHKRSELALLLSGFFGFLLGCLLLGGSLLLNSHVLVLLPRIIATVGEVVEVYSCTCLISV